MNSIQFAKKLFLVFVAGMVVVCLSGAMNAQVKTETTTKSGTAQHDVTIERGEVVAVSGNDLIVKMENGELRHFPNVPESARVNVNGQQLGIHDLKPGMKLERTTVKTTTPQTITTVQTVTGKVQHVSPPNSVILRLEDGTTQQFKIPRGQKFNVDGKETDAFGLRQGMTVSATKIVEKPQTTTSEARTVTGTMPTPPPPDQPILVAVIVPAAPAASAQAGAAQAAPSEAGAAPAEAAPASKLPNTASPLPLIALLGILALASPLALRFSRKRS